MKTEAEIIEGLVAEAREYARQWANADAGKTIFELASALEASEARTEAVAKYEARAVGTMQEVAALFDHYQWMQDGRGLYAYDDAGYDADVRTFMNALAAMLPVARWQSWEGLLAEREADKARIERLRAVAKYYLTQPNYHLAEPALQPGDLDG